MTNSSYDSSASALMKIIVSHRSGYDKHGDSLRGFKSINDLAPDNMSEIFTNNLAYSRENSKNIATDLQVLLVKTCNGQRAFSYRGCGVCNHLDSEFKQASSFKTFKDALK